MNQDYRKLADELGKLPTGFNFSNDGFINYTRGGPASCRVLRVLGPQRMLLLFQYDSAALSNQRGWASSETLYLNKRCSLILFDPEAIRAEHLSQHSKPFHWDREVGNWLGEQGARTFRGRGWATDCALQIRALIGRWQRQGSGGTYKPV